MPAALGPVARGGSALQRLRALFLLRRFGEAFALAERLLDEGPTEEARRALAWPWGGVVPDLGSAPEHLAPDLAALARLTRARPKSPWALFYRGLLMRRCGLKGHADALAAVLDFSPARYGWMRFELARSLLHGRKHAQALSLLDELLRRPGADWTCRGFRAEALFGLGRGEEAQRSLARAAKDLPAHRGDLLAWRGQLLLWLGRPREALPVLDEAASLSARYAFAWRGAALVALGRPKEALRDFDRALALKPWDLEALIWRGEARRATGDLKGALADLDAAAALSKSPWAYCHRGLVHAALGRERALLEDGRRAFDGGGAALLGKELPKSAQAARAALARLSRLPHGDCRAMERL
jgi:tetratricopeptide (TPR) repeat protein